MLALLRPELWHLSVWLLAGLLLGFWLDAWLGMLCLVLLTYLLMQLRQLARLVRWLERDDGAEPPEAGGLWGRLFDILWRRQRTAQSEIHRLQGRLARIEESGQALRDGVVMVDERGDLEWWNPAAQRFLGLHRDKDRGQPILNLLRDPHFVAYFETGVYQAPLLLPSPVLEKVQLECQITRFGENERLMVIRDVSRQQRLERMRQDFVANVSHELRTPLTVLAGYLETFVDGSQDLPPRWRRGLVQMHQQSRRMEHLVKDLLMLSQLESSVLESDREPLPVARLLESIRQDALAVSAEQSHSDASPSGSYHSISLEADAQLFLLGSEQELRSAISNLVVNAVKYTPPGTEILLRWQLENGGARLEVIDSGKGIEPQHLARLTERFYRIDKDRSSTTGGTGLGLAIVKHVMLRHQGRLEIRSEVGEGSRFICHFPASRLANS